jgi:RimJ/RimL family protein N-acetyltransferase
VELLDAVPDLPRWVEARGMLTSGRGSIVEAPPPDPPTMVSAPSVMLAVVFRWDCRDALHRALQKVPREFSIVAPFEAESIVSAALPRREREQATLFHLPPAEAARLAAPDGARLLDEAEYKELDNLPPILRGELRDACRYSPVASAFADERPVSFCYSGWETESHWDLSIDTLESYRRRGLGTAACICLIRHFAARGKTAVWGALESNPASTALASKLGFSPVDQLIVAYPDRAHA